MIKSLSWIPLLFFVIGCNKKATEIESFKVSFYNLENLMDTNDDPQKNDNEFLPNGRYKWTDQKYKIKLKNIAKVIETIAPDVLGIAEVENIQVINELVKEFENSNYEIAHTESYDIRGIDVALIFKKDLFTLISKEDITARLSNGKYAGPRNILKVKLKTTQGRILDFYVNHWPSRRKDRYANRLAFSQQLQQSIQNSTCKYSIVLGDFNDEPTDVSLLNLINQCPNLQNPFLSLQEDIGTLSYKSQWYIFDQILVDTQRMKVNTAEIEDFNFLKTSTGIPARSFKRNKFYENGYSDHFPVSVTLDVK